MLNASVIKRIDITDSLVIFRIKPDDGVNDFKPGQYLALGLMPESERPLEFPPETQEHKPGKIIRRSYSIGSAPGEDYYEFYVAIVPDGALTSRIASLQEGDRLHAAPKVVGKFTLDEVPDDKNLIFVATGTGLAPFTSMINHKDTWTEGRKITLLHGVRFSTDFAYKEDLEKLEKENPNFSYKPIISRASEGWEGDTGYVQNFFKNGSINLDPEKDYVFLCGNPAMIEDVEELLTKDGSYTVHTGRAPGNLHLEKYW